MATQTLEQTAEATVEDLMEIQDNASEWLKLTQHCTRFPMSKDYQLQRSKKYCEKIMNILTQVYKRNLTPEQIQEVQHTLDLRDSI